MAIASHPWSRRRPTRWRPDGECPLADPQRGSTDCEIVNRAALILLGAVAGALLLALGALPQEEEARPDPAAALAEAVALPDAAARRGDVGGCLVRLDRRPRVFFLVASPHVPSTQRLLALAHRS